MIRRILRFIYLQWSWKRLNRHNRTRAKSIFPIEKVLIGRGTYGPLRIRFFGQTEENVCLTIGSYCCISDQVRFMLNENHHIGNLSMYPFYSLFVDSSSIDVSGRGSISVGDDVWIGHSAMIFSGVTIGQGAIIAAGSIVVKSVPPYAIVGGNPARVIKYRFEPEIIKKLIQVDFSKIDSQMVKDNINTLYQKIPPSNVDLIINQLPHK